LARPKLQDSSTMSEVTEPPTVFTVEHVQEIPNGRFCRVYAPIAESVYEGTLIRVTDDSIVLSDPVVLVQKSGTLQLPFDLSKRLFGTADLKILNEDAIIKRGAISSIEVYNAVGSQILIERQADWRKTHKRAFQELTTAPEFPSSG
jgi:hypothetical protein